MIRLLMALVLCAAAVRADPLILINDYTWAPDIPEFGGLSGLALAPDGQKLLAVADKGRYVTADIARDDQSITGIAITTFGDINLHHSGKKTPFLRDAEGLAVDSAGNIFVSFEGYHRVLRYRALADAGTSLHKWDYFYTKLQNNSGLEALAVDADGVIHAIPERSGEWTRPFPVYQYSDGRWQAPFSIPRSKTFLVVGADFGPDGRLYILERAFFWFGGFATRIRRYTPGPDGFGAGETLLETRPGTLDNMEGISLWTDPRGGLMITLISDDNFNRLQRTRLVEYRVVAD